MIKTQSERSHRLRPEALRLLVPLRHLLSRPQSQHQTLLGQRNRSRPIQTKRSIIRNHRDRTSQRLRWDFSLFRLSHPLRINLRQLIEIRLIHFA